jgi:hypothetical protein
VPTIRLTITQDDPDAPVDGVSLLTLTRADTGAAVPFGSAAFTDDGGGVWSHAFVAPAAGLAYAYTFAFHRTDGTTDDAAASTFFDGESAVTGRYTTQAAVRTWLGTINADVLADLDGDGAPDAGAWQQAIADGEDEVDLYASGADWAVPLAFTGVLAAYALYAKRPAAKETTATLDDMRAVMIRQIMRAKNGFRPLPGLASATATPGPQSIAPTRDAFGLPVDTTGTPAPYARPYAWGRLWY